ncbi:hypothetical protein [Sporosarcina cascadiensis]|uniref:hypothetical protein n=1 Tax=Sporosarcina cascadiensis TaxID=2660747 RepID=UPI00129BE258|nr:hypothetical protein [Sporosarcina cascadiensis]
MMKVKIIGFMLCSLILFGCSPILMKENANEISKKQAEKIAIDTATAEGYSNPRLFTLYDTKTVKAFHYSKKLDQDVEVWAVRLLTDDREYMEGMLGDLEYYIDISNGEVVDKISGVD